ncbi:MAG: hypothetical protein DWQ01_13295 [Planctomycetota bacterium]|nr:MAG: hypothetical protein DWQ01_13295 [Planctomycetota bacterium]
MRAYPSSRISGLRPLFWAALLSTAMLLPACGGSGSSGSAKKAAVGNFRILSTNMTEGAIWALNRPIILEFNNPLDLTTVGFGSIIIRPVDRAVQGHPVTGTFEPVAGTSNTTVAFYPSCPTNETSDNGAFVPGGYEYELALPTEADFGSSVLRDTGGHLLSTGLTRSFFTPTPPADPLFIDTKDGAPILIQNAVYPVVPSGPNLFTQTDNQVQIRFDQPVNGDPSNLNTDRLYLLYEDAVGAGTFTSTNRVPGSLLLVENCSREGSLVYFLVQGILPPQRQIRLVVDTAFEDLSGQTNQNLQTFDFLVPDLATFYGDPSFDNDDETADAFFDSFDNNVHLDAGEDLPAPVGLIEDGFVQASFDYPGVQIGPEDSFTLGENLYLEISTDGTTVVTDTSGRDFTVENGVLQVYDLTIEAGATMRGTGSNPLVIYANGTVNVQGTLDVSGEHALTPVALNSPHIPEPGAIGQCGGGDGGTASLQTDRETIRGESGSAPFGAGSGGGQGGEGGIQTNWAFELYPVGGCTGQNALPGHRVIRQLITGGGAGGNFAGGLNEAILWDRWALNLSSPNYDDAGPDYRSDRHTALDPDTYEGYIGGEDGLRGSSYASSRNEPVPWNPFLMIPVCPYANGVWGMEDINRDTAVDDLTGGFDPTWTSGTDPRFNFGQAQFGPDPGFTNTSLFNGSVNDDFWGRRLDTATGTITTGELLTPWAGYGGGASGDLTVVFRLDLNGDSFLDPMGTFFPDTSFPTGSTADYLKGAPGGGGGGQLLVMAIGPIILGDQALIRANGGIGNAGESYWLSTSQISGSGGGSGGHVVLHSATGLDLTAIDVGTDPINNPPTTLPNVIQAIGGRRGWAGSVIHTDLAGHPDGHDGNSDFQQGRGGAGSNGVLQIHVPDPTVDIAWHPDAEAAILTHLGSPADTDRLEEVLDIYAAPKAHALLPLFSDVSMVQSRWIDTGLSGLRNPANGTGPFPDYADALLPAFSGTDQSNASTLGNVLAAGGLVQKGTSIATGSTASATFLANGVTIPTASGAFSDEYLLNPALLLGYDVFPDSSDPVGDGHAFEIVDASYNRTTDVLTLTTRTLDGDLRNALSGLNPTWAVVEKFFRIDTTDEKDRLPDTSSIKVEFQGAAESSPGSNEPGTPGAWTTDPADLQGLRFFRYRMTFDIDSTDAGVTLGSERPEVHFFKVPFVW